MNKQSIVALVIVAVLALGAIIYKSNVNYTKDVSESTPIDTKTVIQNPVTATGIKTSVPTQTSASPVKKTEKTKYDALITLTKNGFVPDRIEIKAGQTVRFLNNSSSAMKVASNPHPTHEIYSELDQNVTVGKGGYYDFIFLRVGAWGYHNHTDPIKNGIVIVHLQ